MQILVAIVIFLEILSMIVIIDVILSWLTLLWLKARPKFIADIIDPIYEKVKKLIPTIFWPVDFTPIIVILLIWFIKWAIVIIFPEIQI